MRTITSFGFTSRRSSQPTPHRSRVPVRKFSTSTSDSATSRFRRSAPAGLRRSRVIDFLFRDSWSQMRLSPVSLALAVPKRRSGSPTPGCSILMTSAPNSARRVPQKGAARKVATSSTRTPSIGRGAPPFPSLRGFACMSYRPPRLMPLPKEAPDRPRAAPQGRGGASARHPPTLHHRRRTPEAPGPDARARPGFRSRPPPSSPHPSSAATGLLSTPIPVISTSTRSPGRRAGDFPSVPIHTTSPGYRVR